MSLLRATSLIAAAIALVGCDDAGYTIRPVTGVVTLSGQPLAGARINTQPLGAGEQNPGPGSFAVTDDAGRFNLELVQPAVPGAVVGSHSVRITKTTITYRPGDEDRPDIQATRLPGRAGDGSLRLEVTVDGENVVSFNL